MDAWDVEDIELLGHAFIEFGPRGDGHFGFVAVEGWMDCRAGQRDGRPCLEFSWEGHDEEDPASGRGWAVLEPDGSLTGHVYLHLADDCSAQCAPIRSRRALGRADEPADAAEATVAASTV